MEKATGAALLVIGVVALFAAIVGGGLKVRDIEVGSVPSRMRQGLLALFGVAIGITGLAIMWDDEQPPTSAPLANLESTNAVDTTDSNATDSNSAEPPTTDANSGDTGAVDQNNADANAGTEAQ